MIAYFDTSAVVPLLLRGYDAVHLAAADRLRDPDLVVVAGDAALLSAAEAEGMATAAVR
ncbi:MAG: hypothetical protein ACRD0Q_07760 [Acidimicrobiales bacterium]